MAKILLKLTVNTNQLINQSLSGSGLIRGKLLCSKTVSLVLILTNGLG